MTGRADRSPLEQRGSRWAVAGFIVLMVAVLLVRWRLAPTPLERDEGEFAHMARQMLSGQIPYLSSYTMKPPGIVLAYGASMLLFGQSATGIHLGLLVASLVSALLLFLLARQFLGGWGAAASGSCYLLLSLSHTVLGFAAHATHYIVLFLLAGLFLLFEALARGRTWMMPVAGFLLGMAYVVKQQAAFPLIFIAGWVLWLLVWQRPGHIRRPWASGGLFLGGLVLPFGLTCGVLAALGAFDKFWFWTFTYPSQLVPAMDLARGLSNLRIMGTPILVSSAPFVLLALYGLYGLFRLPLDRAQRCFLLGFAVASLAAITPGFYFTKHYFVLLLPPLALLAGVGITLLVRQLPVAVLALLISVAYFGGMELEYLFRASPTEVSRNFYPANPFVESVAIGQYLRTHTSSTDRVAVIGSEPQIYFYADRPAATPYNQMYGMMEPHRYALEMQREFLADLAAARPKYLVHVAVPLSWMFRKDSVEIISGPLNELIAESYRQVGVVDEIDSVNSVYLWDEAALTYQPQSKYHIKIYQRRI